MLVFTALFLFRSGPALPARCPARLSPLIGVSSITQSSRGTLKLTEVRWTPVRTKCRWASSATDRWRQRDPACFETTRFRRSRSTR